jgi:hypothetical protein
MFDFKSKVSLIQQDLRFSAIRFLALICTFAALPTLALSPDPLSDERHLCKSNAIFIARVLKAECVEKHSPSFGTQELAHLNKVPFCRSAKYQLEVDESLLGNVPKVGDILFVTAKPFATLTILVPNQEAAESHVAGKRAVFAIDSPGSPFEHRTGAWVVETLKQKCAELNTTGQFSATPVTPADIRR